MKSKAIVLVLCVLNYLAMAQQHDFLSKGRDTVLICGHRGGFYSQLPENSLTAIKYTVSHCKIKPVIVEVDIRKSKEGTLYIMHDETVDRTTNGVGKISDLSDAYLNALYLRTSSGELTNEPIPTFEKVLAYAKSNDVVLMLDIKDDVWKETIELATRYDLIKKCIVLTFDPAITSKVYSLSHAVAISFLAKDEASWRSVQKSGISNHSLIAYITISTKEALIKEFHQLKIAMMTDASESTRNNAAIYPVEFYQEMIAKKQIDILITDFPVDVSQKLK
jgi:glycerophosphoryl diester phosphodiesterase